jgi:hypothetical protein
MWTVFPNHNHKQAVSYCRLSGAEETFARKTKRTPISKRRTKHLQTGLIEAAKLGPRLHADLALIHAKAPEKGNHNRAALTVARKTGRVFARWRLQEDRFQPRRNHNSAGCLNHILLEQRCSCSRARSARSRRSGSERRNPTDFRGYHQTVSRMAGVPKNLIFCSVATLRQQMKDRFCSIQQGPLPSGNNVRPAACYANHQTRLAKKDEGASPSALDKDLSSMSHYHPKPNSAVLEAYGPIARRACASVGVQLVFELRRRLFEQHRITGHPLIPQG